MMQRSPIHRDPAAAADRTFDLIVVGGGIYGVCVALESARRGLRPLLLERDDFGGATSWGSLRIVHGGLRYLQSLDLRRFRESVGERRWFLRNFPDLVRPLACLMPLYRTGSRKPWMLRAALGLNDLLALDRNRGLQPDQHLGGGRMVTPRRTIELFPMVDRQGLTGGGVWADAVMLSSERLLIELARWACGCGATALNYVEARDLVIEKGRVGGIEALDRVRDRAVRFRSDRVVNCAGPWCRSLATRLSGDIPHLFHPSLAFNLLLDRAPVAEAAVAVTPRRPGAPTYFVLPWKGRVFAGTSHWPWDRGVDRIEPSQEQLEVFLNDLNSAIPGLQVGAVDVLRVYSGIMPTSREGASKPASRPVFIRHDDHGGPKGLFSISGVKYTTARLVAQESIDRIAPEAPRRPLARRIPRDGGLGLDLDAVRALIGRDEHRLAAHLEAVVQDESVVHLDDLLLRRGDWGGDPGALADIAAHLCDLLPWDQGRREKELVRLETVLGRPVSRLETEPARPVSPLCVS